MPVVRTFIRHAPEDKPRVRELLRRLAPYGARPWVDEHELRGQAGGSLRSVIAAAAVDAGCRSFSLFLSAASVTSSWVKDEAVEALTLLPQSFRVIPVALDAPSSLALPPALDGALRKRGFDGSFLDPREASYPADHAARVLQASGASDAEELVLHFGHRDPLYRPSLPLPWREMLAVELRLRFPVGEGTFSPTDAEWQEIRDGFASLRRCLSKVRVLRVSGRAPLGVGVIAGRTWDRATGVVLESWNGSERDGQVWTTMGVTPAAGWTPSTGTMLSARVEGNLFGKGTRLTVAFLRRADQEPSTRGWNEARSPSPPLLLVRCPERIASPAEARAVASEVLGAFGWVRRACRHVKEIDLVLGLPLALDVVLAQELKQIGTVHFYDQVLPPGGDPYRVAVTWT